MDKLAGIVVDTTGSNTGPFKDSVSRLKNEQNEAILLIACRRHVNERHIFHFWEKCSKYDKTSSPSNPLFSRLLKKWNDIRQSFDRDNLNALSLEQ